MSIPVKNAGCGPESIYGGFDQNLFLGCSISSFSASTGWNEQVSEITVLLVEDTCPALPGRPKKYRDTNLDLQDWTDPDPGFYGLSLNIIGAPVYFRVGNFEFSGLIQAWEESFSESGNPTYSVKIVDPRSLLQNTQLIINEYAGGVGLIYNLVNVYGYMESFGSVNCPEMYQSSPGLYVPGSGPPDGTVFGSPAGKYGGANVNQNGMQWNQILDGTRLLLSVVPANTNVWSPYGRLGFRCPSTIDDGMGLMVADDLINSVAEYIVDLEEMPIAPSYWRLNGVNTTLMDAISQICQDAGVDYYIELVPLRYDFGFGQQIYKFIKVRTADRVTAPALNDIDLFVAGKNVNKYNKGRELRNEITSAFVIGGPKQSFYQAEQSDDPEGDGQPTPPEKDDMIIPYFGVDYSTGNAIIPYKDADDYWEFTMPTRDLALHLATYGISFPISIVVNEKELLCAEGGFEMWSAYASAAVTDLWAGANLPIDAIFNLGNVIQLITDWLAAGKVDDLRPADMVGLNTKIFAGHRTTAMEVAQILYTWIQKIANEYYGKKFQVRIPWTCGKVDSESGIVITSEEPSDGGWTEVTPVLQLTHPSAASDFFTLDDNRLGAFCRIEDANTKEVSVLDISTYVVDSNKMWIKVDVEQSFVYVDAATLFSPRVVISLPDSIRTIQDITRPKQFDGLAALLELAWQFAANDAKDTIEALQENTGSLYTHVFAQNRPFMPSAAGFGIKSNVLTYGPWGAGGPPGGVEVKVDQGLVPWEYGGFATLDLAGDATASAGVTYTQVTEEGSVTLPGYPELPLGAELRAADSGGPFYNGLGPNLIENRAGSLTTINSLDYATVPIYAWSGTFGPNVTNIQVQVGPDGLETTYTMRTWTPKFGRFQKGNAERIKQIGQNRLHFQKQIRAFLLHRQQDRNLLLLNKNNARIAQTLNSIAVENKGIMGPGHSPHVGFVGQLGKWNNDTLRRPFVESYSMTQIGIETAEKFDEKAFMSLDGLIRPITLSPDGVLPGYGIPLGGCQTTMSRGTQPPVGTGNGTLSQYNLAIQAAHLNAFANPTGFDWDDVAQRTNTPNIGHDIEIIGRGTSIQPSSMLMPIQGYADSSDMSVSDYHDNYRPFALRGPLVMSAWGYDTDGFPVPNKRDTSAADGVFSSGPLEHKFADNFLRDNRTWPTAPIDLRYDRQRGVWTVPQIRHVLATLKQDICPLGTGLAQVVPDYTLYDENGNTISEPTISVVDKVGHECMHSGDSIIAEFNPALCQYRILSYKSKSSGEPFKFRLIECVCADLARGDRDYVRAMKLKYNCGSKTWTNDYEVALDPGINDQWGPAPSGYEGWAIIPQRGQQQTCVSGTCPPESGTVAFSGCYAQVLWMESVAQFIEFNTTQNFGCNTDTCYSSFSPYIANANVSYSWEGKAPESAVVYLGSAHPTGCVGGYGKCSDTVIPHSGYAVLDRTRSSQAICYSSECSGNCQKWVYNIIEMNSKKVVIDHNQCYTPQSGYPRPTLDQEIPYEKLAFGAGTWLFRDEDNPNEEATKEKCKIHVMAGFRPLNNVLCANDAFITGTLTTDGSRFINVVDFQEGLHAVNGPNSCDILLRAGIRARNDSTLCIGSLDDFGSTEQLYSRFRFVHGIMAKDAVSGDCELEIGAGFTAHNDDYCYRASPEGPGVYFSDVFWGAGLEASGNLANPCQIGISAGMTFQKTNTCITGMGTLDTNKNFKNHFILAKGLVAKDGPEPCDIELSAGFNIDNTNTCMLEEDIDTDTYSQYYNKLVAGKGLLIGKTSNCEATIGLAMPIGDYFAAELQVGECLMVTQLDECSVRLDFREGYGNGTVHVSQDVLSSIKNFTCCPSGGISSVTFNVHKMNFNKCGQLISITDGGTADAKCGCTGTGTPGSNTYEFDLLLGPINLGGSMAGVRGNQDLGLNYSVNIN